MTQAVTDPRAKQARNLAKAGAWDDAAPLFEAVALDLGPTDPGAAAQALSLAANAWRCADRPVPAARLLRQALCLLPGDAGRALLKVQLGGVLAEAGQLVPARDILLNARETAGAGMVAALAADTLVGLHLELKDLAAAEDLARSLSVPAARAFRLAMVLRVLGQLTEADVQLQRARARVPNDPAAAGLLAALAHEAGEQALVRDALVEAGAAFTVAQAEWTRAKRRSGVFRAAAGVVRVQLAGGQSPLGAELSRAVEFAEDRGMVMLLAELLRTRGQLRAVSERAGVADDLDRAVRLAIHSGARIAEGRARQARCALGFGGKKERARVDALLSHTVWERR